MVISYILILSFLALAHCSSDYPCLAHGVRYRENGSRDGYIVLILSNRVASLSKQPFSYYSYVSSVQDNTNSHLFRLVNAQCGCIQTILLSYTQFSSRFLAVLSLSLFSCWLYILTSSLFFFLLHLKFEELFVCICRPVVWWKRVTASQPPIISQFVLDLMQQQQQKKEILPSLIPYTIVSTKSSLILVHCCLSGILRSVWLRMFFFFVVAIFSFLRKRAHNDFIWLYSVLRIHGSLAHKVMIQPKLLHSIFLVFHSLSSFNVAFQLDDYFLRTQRNSAHCLPMIQTIRTPTLTTFNIYILIDV